MINLSAEGPKHFLIGRHEGPKRKELISLPAKEWHLDPEPKHILIDHVINRCSRRHPFDSLTAYKCGNGFLIVDIYDETPYVYYTLDKEDIRPRRLIRHIIPKQVKGFNASYKNFSPTKQAIIRCKYGIDDPNDHVVTIDYPHGAVIICFDPGNTSKDREPSLDMLRESDGFKRLFSARKAYRKVENLIKTNKDKKYYVWGDFTETYRYPKANDSNRRRYAKKLAEMQKKIEDRGSLRPPKEGLPK